MQTSADWKNDWNIPATFSHIETGKTEIFNTKLMHLLCWDQLRSISDERTSSSSELTLCNNASSLQIHFQPISPTESEWEAFGFKLYFSSVYCSKFEVCSPRDNSNNWLTNQQCTAYTASPTLKCERISDAERNMDPIEIVQRSQVELINYRNVKRSGKPAKRGFKKTKNDL